jgi:hypothetical protein
LASSVLHFFATSTEIAAAGTGTASRAVPIKAASAPAPFNLVSIHLPLFAAATPCAPVAFCANVSHYGKIGVGGKGHVAGPEGWSNLPATMQTATRPFR